MNNDKIPVTQNFNKKCLVLGDIILDRYISGNVNRISPEAPIPVVLKNNEWNVLGGAANVACNVTGCLVETILIGVLGEDSSANIVLEMLEKNNIIFKGLQITDRVTTTKTRITGLNQQIVRLDEEVTSPILSRYEDCIIRNVMNVLDDIGVIIISDYNKGVCTEKVCKVVIDMARKNNIFVLVDPKDEDWSKYSYANIITPNFKEFCEVMNSDVKNDELSIIQGGKRLFSLYNIASILVTRSQDGMTYLDCNNENFSISTKAQEVYDVSGAGDTVIAVIGAMVSKGYSVKKAIEISNYAAGIAVSKMGTYIVKWQEIIDFINEKGFKMEQDIDSKIVSKYELKNRVCSLKEQNKKIIFTNGCFDILHRGHVSYLNEARRRGDYLIVGINTDNSVKRLKGQARPVNNQDDRAYLLAALSCVDMVVMFDEDTPYNLIKLIEPDELIKGGDYRAEEVIGGEYAKEVVILPFVDGYSTTKVLDEMERLNEKVL